jgi:TrmH family RNA methyltransferase
LKRISSLQNPRVKDAMRLRQSRHRRKQGRFLIDGAREISRALEAGIPAVEAFVCPALCDTAERTRTLEQVKALGIPVWEIPPQVFERLAFGERTEGILLVAKSLPRTLAELAVPERAVVAVVEGIEKPGNLGAILRSADATGVSVVIVTDARSDLYNPNCIRASLGTVFTLPVVEAQSAEALAWLRKRELRVFAARPDAAFDYTQADLHAGGAIVLGSEAAGLSNTWNGPEVTPIRLPMLGVADSLNVSVTAAVLFYEALRQRRASQA